MIKVVFINAYEPSYLGTRCLASFLKKYGFETHNILLGGQHYIIIENPTDERNISRLYLEGVIFEQRRHSIPLGEQDFQHLETILKEEQPDIIGFSARTTNNCLVPSLVPIFKKVAPGALLVAGGYGPTLEPEVYLDGGFDVVVRGDGEEPLLKLARCVEHKDFASITGVHATSWSKRWGGAHNPLDDQKKDLSEYPAPLSGNAFFSYIDDGRIKRNFDPVLSGEAYTTFFGRGCIGRCSYCSGGQWSALYRQEGKKSYQRRNRNIKSLIDEIKSLPKNIKIIFFDDEYWSLSTEQCREFFTLYKKYIGLPFYAYLGYDQMVTHPDLFELALDAGFYKTGIGFQTGSGEFLQKYYNRKPNYDVLLTYSHMLFKNKVIFIPQFIGGNCYETMDDFLQTIDIARKLPFSIEIPFLCRPQITQLSVYPKAPLREIAPRVVSDPMPVKEWYYRAILFELARIVSVEKFNAILNMKRYKKNPQQLQKLYRILLFNLQYDHFKKLINEGKNNDWIYYGGGFTYTRNKNFFSELNPKMIIIDKEYYKGEKFIDGIPVMMTDDFFTQNNPGNFKFLVFIPSELSCVAIRKLSRTYNVPYENIHSCLSCHNLSPFAADLIDQFRDPTF